VTVVAVELQQIRVQQARELNWGPGAITWSRLPTMTTTFALTAAAARSSKSLNGGATLRAIIALICRIVSFASLLCAMFAFAMSFVT
jgi:hypothetical protein